ncbi:MAG: hypothetical protein ACWGOV_11910 [Acidiferrobacterales bacterium]
MKRIRLHPFISMFLGLSLGLAAPAVSADEMNHHREISTDMHHHQVLTEPGNDAFGTIQEVVRKLRANPHTDWSRVNLEALRQHLVDMDNFTKHVNVVSKRNIKSGVELQVRADSKEASQSLARALAAHPRMIKEEFGWDIDVSGKGPEYRLRVTSPRQQDVEQIRGLGYIGIMALGQHHQMHHWMIATGGHPHPH